MLAISLLISALLSPIAAQQTTFGPTTGVRSLWIPFYTISGTPLASIAGNNSQANLTTYVLYCPTESPSCSLAPNFTLTEGPSTAIYTTANSAGAAFINCALTGTTAAVCNQLQTGGGNVARSSVTLGASNINYQAVDVTATMNNTSTMPVTVTVTAKPSTTSTSSTSSSTAGAETMGGPWAMGGAVGMGLLALAAL